MGPTGAALTGPCRAPSEDGPRPRSWSPPSTQASRARPGTPLAGSPGAGGPAGRWREGGVEGAWDKWVPERGALVTQARAALPAWEVPVSTPAVDLQLPGPEEAREGMWLPSRLSQGRAVRRRRSPPSQPGLLGPRTGSEEGKAAPREVRACPAPCCSSSLTRSRRCPWPASEGSALLRGLRHMPPGRARWDLRRRNPAGHQFYSVTMPCFPDLRENTLWGGREPNPDTYLQNSCGLGPKLVHLVNGTGT